MTLQEKMKQLSDSLSLFPDWRLKYEFIIEAGKVAPSLTSEYKTDMYKIQGCQSQVWMVPRIKDGLLYVDSDSDSIIAKGTASFISQLCSGVTPQEVIDTDLMKYFVDIGLLANLTPTRASGVTQMVGAIKKYCLSLNTHS